MRLVAVSLGLLMAGILVSDVLVLRELRRHLVDRVDRQVVAFGQLMGRLGPGLLSPADPARSDQLLGGLDLISDFSVVYLDASGSVTWSASAHHSSARPPDPAAVRRSAGAVSAPGPDGSTWRMVVVPRAGGGVVVVGASLAAVDDIVTRLLIFCLITEAVLVVALGVAGWFGVPAALRPLRDIERTATRIAGGDLSRRVPVEGPPGSEVARLAGVLNDMLARIELAFAARAESEARMRRFVADVGHELRTPLFGIAGSAELYLMRGSLTRESAERAASGAPEAVRAGRTVGDLRDVTGADRAMRRIDTEARRLTGLVEDLLLLARLDEPASGPALEMAPMDLRTLAADARDQFADLDPDRPVTLSGVSGAGPPGAAPVLGDEARLRQVVVNLVGNVHAHTPPEGPVRIGVGQAGEEAVLEVADSGPGIPPGERERVFERFHRGETSRDRSRGGGSGLGLSIVRSLVNAHGGRVEVRDGADRGAVFRVVLPLHREPA
ncbi:HAMP domain-containing sensor histidine kinase [Actinoplanes oblitus]|uniref:histidine kinase n=1 Tax=Actinoplanes oblitus TaxID=3040509 RepID=A0ABY8W870_9ACTN|nr:HAMP domain-containing sensor histidine kinase [Actinoplanes oblitus]WIM93697.1 HAMP domain-containing sensor histidine kinase [Actinoplanes oblitus]